MSGELRGVPAPGGCRRTAQPAAAGRKSPPSQAGGLEREVNCVESFCLFFAYTEIFGDRERMPSLALDPAVQPMAVCPKCGTVVPLTEALAAPLLKATRAEYENKLKTQRDDFLRQEQDLGRRERAAEEARQQVERREAELNARRTRPVRRSERKGHSLRPR